MSLSSVIRTHEERRMHAQLLGYWDALKKDGLPREQDVDPADLSEWWPQMFLLDIQRKDFPLRLHYSYMGDLLVEACGGDLSGQAVCLPGHSIPAAIAQEGLHEAAEQVVRDKIPLMQEGDCLDCHGVWVHYRRVLLPLSREGQQVDYILGGVAWRLA